MSNTTGNPPTVKQLRYLRTLAARTGTTFTAPTSRQKASREIARMRNLPTASYPRAEQDAPVAYGTEPVDEEVNGYGADAHWRHTKPARQRKVNGVPERPTPARHIRASVILTHTPDGERRQILSIPLGEQRLLIDRLQSGGDARLLARLGADEPPQNALLIARMYVADPDRRLCRRVTRADLKDNEPQRRSGGGGTVWQAPLLAALDVTFRLQPAEVRGKTSLRWTERRGHDGSVKPVALRHVIGSLQSYDPAIAMTDAAIRAHKQTEIPVTTLTNELARLRVSPIVLNKALRDRVTHAIEHEDLTMSVIAIRCGRVKRTERGCESGETSWLARRIGLAPEAGADRPTPWIHTDVLALIARDGLGIAPAEAELPPAPH
jgi:hypothetical protein